MEPPKILVVEDEAIVAADIQSKLRRLGYAVTGCVASGADAMELSKLTPPNIVLMDIRIEGDMDGIETALQLTDRFGCAVVFLTACADDAVLERAKAAQPFGYIVKPFSDRDLHVAIEVAATHQQTARPSTPAFGQWNMDTAVKALKQRRTEIDEAIHVLERLETGIPSRGPGRPKGSRNMTRIC